MRKKNTYEMIIDTAYTMFAVYGFEETSLSMIAEKINISKPAIYYHFKSKQQLMNTIFTMICDEVEKTNDFSFEAIDADNYRDAVQGIGKDMIKELEQDPYFYQIFNRYMLRATEYEFYNERLQAIQQQSIESFRELLAHGVSLGIIKNDALLAKSDALALLYDNMSSFILMGKKLPYEDIWTVTVDNLLFESESTKNE